MFLDDGHDPAARIFHPNSTELRHRLAMIQFHEMHVGKTLPKAGDVFRPATIHHDDLKGGRVLLREHRGQAVIDERRSNDGGNDDRNDGWRGHWKSVTGSCFSGTSAIGR